MIKRRTKMVSIRLLDDEYRRLKEMCEVRGARSVSDLARDAMFGLLGESEEPGGRAKLEARIRILDQKVATLQEQMDAMTTRLDGSRTVQWGS